MTDLTSQNLTSSHSSHSSRMDYQISEIAKERLTILANFLETIPPEAVDLKYWMRQDSNFRWFQNINAVLEDDTATVADHKPGSDSLPLATKIKPTGVAKDLKELESRTGSLLVPVRSGITPSELTACGTTACALGWAALLPKFRELGLTLVADKRTSLLSGQQVNSVVGYVTYKGAIGQYAAAEFFDIPLDVAETFFVHDAGVLYYSPKHVATRIKEFLTDPEAYAIKYECVDL